MIIHADCLAAMAEMPAESVDAVVTDPPYGLGFMGKAWDNPTMVGQTGNTMGLMPRREDGTVDYEAPHLWKKGPGTHSRGLADNDPILYGRWSAQWAEAAYRVAKPSAYLLAFGGTRTVHRMTVALEGAGWIIRDMLVWAYASGFPKSKASLKPAWEPIVMARKPGPLRELAIDACRIGVGDEVPGGGGWAGGAEGRISMRRDSHIDDLPTQPHTLGRWPANVILTDPIFDGGIEGVVGGGEAAGFSGGGTNGAGFRSEYVGGQDKGWVKRDPMYFGDSGTYSRFFLVPKSDRSEREPVVGIGGEAKSGGRVNVHPTQTVKPVDLMRHLVRLVTPPQGRVLDPFLGSGTTGIACEMEGFDWIGIEKEAEYVAIARARMEGVQRGFGLEGLA